MPLRKWHRHQVKEREQFLSQWLPESSVKNGNGSRKTHRKCVLGFGVLQRESIKHASAGKGRAVACRMGTPPAGPEPVSCDMIQKLPSLVFSWYMSAWDAVGPWCPGAVVLLGFCLLMSLIPGRNSLRSLDSLNLPLHPQHGRSPTPLLNSLATHPSITLGSRPPGRATKIQDPSPAPLISHPPEPPFPRTLSRIHLLSPEIH